MNTPERGIEEYKMPSIEVDGHSWIRLIDHITLVDQQLQKAREEERERCIQAIKNPLTAWECIADLEDGDAHNHKTITVCRAVASINSNKTNGL